ncbi:MAG TPA: glycerol-3-phosphate 1-O-acyltransferase PlsY [Terriglobales bacterium]|nr:glycerol-3-phosphate 1-O-acyltransferase PlsY [Terriglobales bacterium]
MASFKYELLITAVLSYILGSIPFGYILVRIFRGQDIRRSGSGNIGATNVARSSPALGGVTLLLDALKGLAAVVIARAMFPHQQKFAAMAALFAIVGHILPVWLKFRGGKGVATALGGFVMLTPKAVLAVLGIFIGVVLAFRYVSLGSIVAVALFPLLAWLTGYRDFPIGVSVGAALLIIVRHHENIRRLVAGTEPRFQWRRG